MRSDKVGICSYCLINLFFEFDFRNDFFGIMEIFCFHFFTFFTWGEDGEERQSQI